MPWQYCGKNCPRGNSEKKTDPEASIFQWCSSLLFGWFGIWQLNTWTMASFDLTVPPHLGEVVCPAHFRTCTILYQDLFTFSYFYTFIHFWVNPYGQPDCKISSLPFTYKNLPLLFEMLTQGTSLYLFTLRLRLLLPKLLPSTLKSWNYVVSHFWCQIMLLDA